MLPVLQGEWGSECRYCTGGFFLVFPSSLSRKQVHVAGVHEESNDFFNHQKLGPARIH